MGTEFDDNEIRLRLASLQQSIVEAAARSGRSASEINLLGVTKTVSPERILVACKAGLHLFGENYVQEAREKIPAIAKLLAMEHGDGNSAENYAAKWQCIGHLQSNKAKYAVDLFSVLETVDNFALAEEISKQAAKRSRNPTILIEVNISRNPERAGVLPDQALELAEKVVSLPAVRLEGMMGIAPYSENPEDSRPYFRALYELYNQLPQENRRILSMGMSGDFEIAIEEGATEVRLGTALFGRR